MRLGSYDQRIEFFKEGQQSDGAGGYYPVEEIVLKTWSAIEQLPQSRNIEQVQMGLPSTYRVKVQVRKGFNPDVSMLVKWRGQAYTIITSPVVKNVRVQQEWIFDISIRNGGN